MTKLLMHLSVIYILLLYIQIFWLSVDVKKEPSSYFMLKERITKTIQLYYF